MNGIAESTTTTGTGDLTTSAITGRPRFTDFFTANASEASADIFPYSIWLGDAILEWGKAWMSAVGTLKRAEVLGTYDAGTLNVLTPTALNLPAGTKTVRYGPLADDYTPGLLNIDSTSTGITRGQWGGIQTDAGSTGALVVANRCYYHPIYISAARLSTGVMLGLTAAGAGTAKTRVGLYAVNRNGYPGRKLAETADIDLTVGGGTVVTAAWAGGNTKLKPGWYFITHCHAYGTTQPTLARMETRMHSMVHPLGVTSSNPTTGTIIGRFETLTGGWTALPVNASASTTAIVLNSNDTFKVGVTFA